MSNADIDGVDLMNPIFLFQVVDVAVINCLLLCVKTVLS